jgi:Cu-Zn family superoxide dismutase
MKEYLCHFAVIILAVVAVAVNGCGRSGTEMSRETIQRAVAVLSPTEGSFVHGTVTFSQEGLGLHVSADIEGLTPGKHGFHIHQFGDLSAPDAKSAGGHFNPDNQRHGSPTDQARHVGDLGNIVADSAGKAHLDWTDTLIKFSGAHNIIGRAVIVHAGPDDLSTQPTGNAGARVACGVIGIAGTP